MKRAWFITGTDTGVGKTTVACALLQAWRERGETVVGMKPVASGCRSTPAGLRSDDALALAALNSIECPYGDINPYAFGPAIAPHLAAKAVGTDISLPAIAHAYERMASRATVVLVEGVGGWRVPLNTHETAADLAVLLRLPIILVVGMRLGCINHALLTAESIRHAGSTMAGWLASAIDPAMESFDDNVETLRDQLRAPLLGVIPFLRTPNPTTVARAIDIAPLSL
jgi:dethiobiotin synthetase